MEEEEAPRKPPPRKERMNAQFSTMPATECIGCGRLDGWFVTPAYIAENRGWGHIESFCFEGQLFFHLQRSPWLRGINFQKKTDVTFEVIELNGKIEAVKLLLPDQVKDIEEKKVTGGVDPEAEQFVGQRILGFMKSHHMLVEKQHWGFVGSEVFSGQVFWHTSENPDMEGVSFDRDDIVEYDLVMDGQKGGQVQVRAKNMAYISQAETPIIAPPELSESKRRKKEQWLKNWSSTPPPDWVCSLCGWKNFGRNKTCNFNNKPGRHQQNCPGVRPPREEWPDTQHVKAADVDSEDATAKKALQQRRDAHREWGKEEEVPTGWHAAASSSSSSAPAGREESKPSAPIPVPTLGAENMPILLQAGLPGAVAAMQLQERLKHEEAWKQTQAAQTTDVQVYGRVVVPPPPPRPAAGQASWNGAQAANWSGGGGYGGYGGGGYAGQEESWGSGYGGKGGYGGGYKGDGKGKKGCKAGKPEPEAAGSVPTEDVEATMTMCLCAFNDLMASEGNQDAEVANLVAQVNDALGADRNAKHAFAMQLARHPFFAKHEFEVRYSPGKNQIIVAQPGVVLPPQVVLPPDAQQRQLLAQT